MCVCVSDRERDKRIILKCDVNFDDDYSLCGTIGTESVPMVRAGTLDTATDRHLVRHISASTCIINAKSHHGHIGPYQTIAE